MTITLSISTIFLIIITIGISYLWYKWIDECDNDTFKRYYHSAFLHYNYYVLPCMGWNILVVNNKL